MSVLIEVRCVKIASNYMKAMHSKVHDFLGVPQNSFKSLVTSLGLVPSHKKIIKTRLKDMLHLTSHEMEKRRTGPIFSHWVQFVIFTICNNCHG